MPNSSQVDGCSMDLSITIISGDGNEYVEEQVVFILEGISIRDAQCHGRLM